MADLIFFGIIAASVIVASAVWFLLFGATEEDYEDWEWED